MSGLSRDDIFRMAREAGVFDEDNSVNGEYNYDDEVKKFADLVAAAEREACAKICEKYYTYHGYQYMADDIRARGNDAA